MIKFEVTATATAKKVSVMMEAGEMIAISEQMQNLMYVKLPINKEGSLNIAVLIEFFGKNLNKVVFEKDKNLSFSIPQAIAFWQIYVNSDVMIMKSLAYYLADAMIENGIVLYEKK